MLYRFLTLAALITLSICTGARPAAAQTSSQMPWVSTTYMIIVTDPSMAPKPIVALAAEMTLINSALVKATRDQGLTINNFGVYSISVNDSAVRLTGELTIFNPASIRTNLQMLQSELTALTNLQITILSAPGGGSTIHN
jgi:hypothetical protein